jgi:hypothetical protein
MTARITNLLVSLIALGVVAALAGAVVLTALAATGDVGDPNGCRSEIADAAGNHEVRGVDNDPAIADAFEAKWQAFDAQLDAGQSASVSFTESEATSRAQRYLDAKEALVRNLQICFHEGFAEATGNVEMPILADLPGIGESLNTNIRARGAIDFSGAKPRIVIAEIEAGNLPTEASERLRGRIEGAINERLNELFLQHQHAAKFTEGAIEIGGTP